MLKMYEKKPIFQWSKRFKCIMLSYRALECKHNLGLRISFHSIETESNT